MVEFGDGLSGLRSLTPNSVGLVLSDLPSGETAAEFDIHPNLQEFWPAIWRVTNQAVVMAHSIRFAAELIASAPNQFRYDLIWEKTLAVGFLNAKHRPLRAHEFVLVFSQCTGTYNPQMSQGATPIHSNNRELQERATQTVSESYGASRSKRGQSRAGATDRFPRSVLHFGSIPTRSQTRTHPQQKPDSLLRMLVRQYSNPGELIVDPYAGSGSTGAAAIAEGRLFRGWDSCPRFGKVSGVSGG